MAAIGRVPYVTKHSFQHQPKKGNCRDVRYISWYKYSLQGDTTIDPNPHLYFYWVIWNAIREFVTEKLIQLWWNLATHARSYFCFLSSRDVVCLISTQNPSCVALNAMCDLTVLLHNYQNLMLLVVICHWCDVDVFRDPGNVSTSNIAQHTVWELQMPECGSVILKVASRGLQTKARDNGRTTSLALANFGSQQARDNGSLLYHVMSPSLVNLLEDWAPADFIYGCSIL